MELRGTGFIIRGWEKGDAASLQKHADNPKVSDRLMDRFPSPYTIEAAVNWVNSLVEQDPLINFAITINNEVIGGIGIEPRQDVYRKTAILGYWLSEELWGRGICPKQLSWLPDMLLLTLALSAYRQVFIVKTPHPCVYLKKRVILKREL